MLFWCSTPLSGRYYADFGMMRVVYCSTPSLFSQGTVNRLRAFERKFELAVIQPGEPGIVEEIAKFQPGVVILDISQYLHARTCPIGALLRTIPDLRVIELDPSSAFVTVISSARHQVENLDELIAVIAETS